MEVVVVVVKRERERETGGRGDRESWKERVLIFSFETRAEREECSFFSPSSFSTPQKVERDDDRQEKIKKASPLFSF